MSVATIGTILGLLQKYGPEVAKIAIGLLTKKDPTKEDWDNLFNSVQALDYDAAIAKAKEDSKK